jgi:hypothetical protein
MLDAEALEGYEPQPNLRYKVSSRLVDYPDILYSPETSLAINVAQEPSNSPTMPSAYLGIDIDPDADDGPTALRKAMRNIMDDTQKWVVVLQ